MKVAIIRFSSLGDVILSSVVLQPLYEADFDITFITFKPFDQLFKKDYRIKNLVALEKSQLKTFNQIKDFAKKFKNYDVIFDLHFNLRSLLISKLSGVKTYRYNKKSIQRRMLTKPILKNFTNLKDFNVIKAYLQPLKKIGLTDLSKYKANLIIDENDFPNIRLPTNFVAIGTGARYEGKMYPYYKEVINLLQNKKDNIVLIGSKEDKIQDKNRYENVIDLRGKLNLRQSLTVLSKAKLTISNDSAIAHMSRAVKTPVLVIYGATHPYFGFYPLSDEGSFLYADIPCQPCDLHGKKRCKLGNYDCFSSLSPYQVVEKALSLL